MNRAPRKLAVAGGALVGHEIDRDAAPHQRNGERFGRKQVPTGPARCHDNERRGILPWHQAVLPAAAYALGGGSSNRRGRSRVKAISIPIP